MQNVEKVFKFFKEHPLSNAYDAMVKIDQTLYKVEFAFRIQCAEERSKFWEEVGYGCRYPVGWFSIRAGREETIDKAENLQQVICRVTPAVSKPMLK